MFESMTSGDRRLCFFASFLGLLGTPVQIKENPIAMSEAEELKILTQTFVAKNLSNLVTFRRQQLHFLNNGFDYQKLKNYGFPEATTHT